MTEPVQQRYVDPSTGRPIIRMLQTECLMINSIASGSKTSLLIHTTTTSTTVAMICIRTIIIQSNLIRLFWKRDIHLLINSINTNITIIVINNTLLMVVIPTKLTTIMMIVIIIRQQKRIIHHQNRNSQPQGIF